VALADIQDVHIEDMNADLNLVRNIIGEKIKPWVHQQIL
jgi:hypothetical protein